MSARRGKRLISRPVMGAKMMWLFGKAWWKFVSPSFSSPKTCSVISAVLVNLSDNVPVIGSACRMSETPGQMITVSWGRDMAWANANETIPRTPAPSIGVTLIQASV